MVAQTAFNTLTESESYTLATILSASEAGSV